MNESIYEVKRMKLIFHSLRCLFSLWKGQLDRPSAVRDYEQLMQRQGSRPQLATDAILRPKSVSTESVLLPIEWETKMKMYMGLRLCDSSLTVNPMRYLEVFELARWHHMGVTGIGKRSVLGCIFPVVSSSNIQFLAPLRPFQMVFIRTKICGVSGKGLIHLQQIESIDGEKVYAVGLLRLSWLEKESPSLLAKHIPGTLEVVEALRRMGCSENDIHILTHRPNISWRSQEDLVSDELLNTEVTDSNTADKVWRDEVNSTTKQRKGIMKRYQSST